MIARRKPRGTKTGAPVHDDLLQRHFHADRANIAWVIDITEHWTGEGKLYLCAIKDLYSRKIVGYAMRKRGFPRGVIVPDRGSQLSRASSVPH